MLRASCQIIQEGFPVVCRYMAPELVGKTSGRWATSSDAWSVEVVCWAVLYGELPFRSTAEVRESLCCENGFVITARQTAPHAHHALHRATLCTETRPAPRHALHRDTPCTATRPDRAAHPPLPSHAWLTLPCFPRSLTGRSAQLSDRRGAVAPR